MSNLTFRIVAGIGLLICGLYAHPVAVSQQFASGPAATDAALVDGTPIRFRTSRTVSSADARIGDIVNLEVLDEVKVDDTVVIPKGGIGLAIVTLAEPKKLMGRGGRLDISIDSAKLVDGQKVALRAVNPSGGANPTSIISALAQSNVSSAPLIFVRGKDAIVPQGTEFVGYVNGTVSLHLQNLQPETLAQKNDAVARANSATEIHISTFPSPAEIQIDGKFIAMSPSDVIVRAGEHKIALRLAGFKTWHKTITAAGEKLSLRVNLEQDGSNGSVVSNCAGTDCSDLGNVARQSRSKGSEQEPADSQ